MTEQHEGSNRNATTTKEHDFANMTTDSLRSFSTQEAALRNLNEEYDRPLNAWLTGSPALAAAGDSSGCSWAFWWSGSW